MLISSYEELQAYIPNAVGPAMGDRNLFDKIYPYLESAERWLASEICLPYLFPNDSYIRNLMRSVVALTALHTSFALLDMVVTPNGFGVVSTDTIAPASRERTEAAARAILMQRDSEALNLIEALRVRPDWYQCHASEKFLSVLYTPQMAYLSPEELREYPGKPSGPYWDVLMVNINRYATSTAKVARRFLSSALMKRICLQNLRRDFDRPQELITLAREVCERIANQQHAKPLIEDMVDMVRKDPEAYPEWQDSPASKRFSRPIFENNKKSGGVWL